MVGGDLAGVPDGGSREDRPALVHERRVFYEMTVTGYACGLGSAQNKTGQQTYSTRNSARRTCVCRTQMILKPVLYVTGGELQPHCAAQGRSRTHVKSHLKPLVMHDDDLFLLRGSPHTTEGTHQIT